ncbi:hypothetical protein LAD67_09805 [Escherichia coli]|nr:hypothetical protein [Escherichia coli]
MFNGLKFSLENSYTSGTPSLIFQLKEIFFFAHVIADIYPAPRNEFTVCGDDYALTALIRGRNGFIPVKGITRVNLSAPGFPSVAVLSRSAFA